MKYFVWLMSAIVILQVMLVVGIVVGDKENETREVKEVNTPEVNCHWELVCLKLTADKWDWNLLTKVINKSLKDYKQWEIVWVHPDSDLILVKVYKCEPVISVNRKGIL